MTQASTGTTEQALGDIARRHGFSDDAARALAEALSVSGGAMAQFSHPELGGMGQWSQGGMLMIGDMFNADLKARVGLLAADLSEALRSGAIAQRPRAAGTGDGSAWWPVDLGAPASSGAQNGRRYAVFPEARRLAVERDGRVSVHDTGDHRIGGVSQQQGSGSTLSFSSDQGALRLEDLPEVGGEAAAPASAADRPNDVTPPPAADAPLTIASSGLWNEGAAARPERPAAPDGSDPVELIRRLAELRDSGALTDEEFAAKKAEVLTRL